MYDQEVYSRVSYLMLDDFISQLFSFFVVVTIFYLLLCFLFLFLSFKAPPLHQETSCVITLTIYLLINSFLVFYIPHVLYYSEFPVILYFCNVLFKITFENLKKKSYPQNGKSELYAMEFYYVIKVGSRNSVFNLINKL